MLEAFLTKLIKREKFQSKTHLPLFSQRVMDSCLEINAGNWAKSNVRLSQVLLLKIFCGHFTFPAKTKGQSDFAPFEEDL